MDEDVVSLNPIDSYQQKTILTEFESPAVKSFYGFQYPSN
jgi:hypothetical protein